MRLLESTLESSYLNVRNVVIFPVCPEIFVGPEPISANDVIQSFEEYQNLFSTADPGQLRGDISPDYLFYYQKAVPKILDEIGTKVPIVIVLRNPIDRAYSNYLQKVRDRLEKMVFEDALDAEAERRAANWAWGWGYVEGGLYAEPVKAYLDNFERVLLLLFEEDIVMGRATGKVLNFLSLEPCEEGPDNVQANISGYPQNRLLHRLMTDELVVRKVKNMVKATPLYARSKRMYLKIMEANLKKEAMALETRQMLKEKFQDNVSLLAQQTKIARAGILDRFSIRYPYYPVFLIAHDKRSPETRSCIL